MVEVVGVRFRSAGRIYYYQPGDEEYFYGQPVVVESQQCKQIGYIAIPRKDIAKNDVPDGINPIIRTANQKDIEQQDKNEKDARDAFPIAKQKILERKLEMKLMNVEYTFDRNKMVFSFTADGRIDFRELVKDLATLFKTRIELRQVGVRDEAKQLGGLGPCGRPLCCSTFLGDFVPVSIKMAKDQNLSLNPTKISGLCGRLMCCLKYENDEYELAKKELPDIGKEVVTPEGVGRVVGLNLLARVVKVRLSGRELICEYLSEEITLNKRNKARKDNESTVKEDVHG